MPLTDAQIEELRTVANGMGFGRTHDAIITALNEIRELRENWGALQHALVGKTGLSAMQEARRLRELHPLERKE